MTFAPTKTAFREDDGNISIRPGLVDRNFSLLALETKKLTNQITSEISKIDLEFTGDSGAGRINVGEQKFAIEGTTDQISTSASNQKLTIGLPADLTITTSLTIDTLVISSGSITDSGGTIDFDDEDLTTTGDITCNTLNYTSLNPPVAAAGADTNVQYNDSGDFGADSDFVYDKAGKITLSVAVDVATGGNYRINGNSVLNVDGTECLNVGVGAGTGASGNNCTFIGNNSGNGSGSNNVCVGADSGEAITTADGLTLVGYGCGKRITDGIRNTLYGFGAGQYITSGKYNCLFGHRSGTWITTADYISLYGVSCGAAVTTANLVTGFGYGCLNDLTTSSQVTAFGAYAAQRITSGGTGGTFMGYACGGNSTGQGNSMFGNIVAGLLQGGDGNTLIGYRASYGTAFYASNYNTAIGSCSLYTSGNSVDRCIGVGYYAGYYNTTANSFFIDSIQRSNAADELIKSPIRGTIAAASADQDVVLNAKTLIRHSLTSPPDEITATDAGVAASLTTINTEVTTNGDSDLDEVTLANGTSGQIKHIYCVAVGNAADSFKITPANMVGGTQITFGASPLGLGCTLVYADNEGWVVVANNGGVIA